MTAISRTTAAPLRVIQWTTGNIGRRSLHAIIGRDDAGHAVVDEVVPTYRGEGRCFL